MTGRAGAPSSRAGRRFHPHDEARHGQRREPERNRGADDLVREAEVASHVQRRAIRNPLRDASVARVIDVGQHAAAVLIDVQRAFGARIGREIRNRVDARRLVGQRDAVVVGDSVFRGERDHVVDRHARGRRRSVGAIGHGRRADGPRRLMQREVVHLHVHAVHRVLIRVLRCRAGRGRMHMRFAPRALRIAERRRCRERLELLAPRSRPRQPREHEEQRADGEPDAAHRMQIAPPRASLQRQTRQPHAALSRVRPARPPQRDARADHHEGPAAGQFHHEFAGLAEHQPAMQIAHLLHQSMLDGQRAEHRAVIGIHIHAFALARRQAKDELGAARAIGFDLRERRHGAGRLVRGGLRKQDIAGKLRSVRIRDDHPVAIQQRLDLRLEAIDRAGDREHDEQRHHEERRIEMPAPERATMRRDLRVQVGCKHGDSR